MTDKKDDYYQPWLRDPAPAPDAAPRPSTAPDEGLAKPRETPPVGIDLSRYPAEDRPAHKPVVTSDQLKAGAVGFWQVLRTGGGAFADWTIRVGERADIPARIDAMEIPRRSYELAAKTGTLTARAARAFGRGSARAGRSAAKAGGDAWDRMALGDKARKLSTEAGRGLGEVAGKTRAGVVDIAKAGSENLREQLGEAATRLRPAPREELAPPPSGLEQLLAREEAAAQASGSAAPDLPLFAGDAAIPAVAKPAAAEDDDRSPLVQQTRTKAAGAKAMSAARLPQVKGIGMESVSTRTWTMGLAAIVLLALVFWLGGRLGGGMSKSEVETVVAEYIKANPQIIPEALEAQRNSEMAKAIDAIRPALEKPYAGAWAGNADGDVTLVVFTDYACGFCRASVPDVDRLIREDRRVKVVFRELPIIAPQSRDAALMALAAARQGKYDAFHHAMFAAGSLDKAAINAAAQKVGVVTDGTADATANEALFQRELDSNIAIATQLQLNATPTWVVGDQLFQGQIGYDGLKQAVAKARAAKRLTGAAMATLTHDEALANARRLLTDQPGAALAQAQAIIEAVPTSAAAYRLAAHALRILGRERDAQAASLAAVGATIHDEAMVDAALALAEDRLPDAESALRQRLREDATDVAAIRMLAEVAGRIGRYEDAEKLLSRALQLAPGFGAARANLATVYYKQNRFADAAETLDAVLGDDPDNPAHANLRAAALGRIGGYDEALGLYDELTRRFPDHAKLWMSYGHLLKTVGRQDDSIAAYRRALAADPGLGEIWWSLANLKTIRFDAADRAAMEAALAAAEPESDARADDRLHLHFALGKAYDDDAGHEAAFRHYAAGNAIRAVQLGYRTAETSTAVDKIVTACTPDFFATRDGVGDPAADPIFIVGMPRAGSTLIEQILASHSAIEGTMELPDIPALALGLGREAKNDGRRWIEALAEAPRERLAELGAAFLQRTAVQRKTPKPFYIDKLPNNWLYTAFIRLALPNARIIDARRHPLDCCFSNFRQHYAKGQAFSYGLVDVGAYYRDYVRLMAHIDAVQPGRVHRVIHEALLDDPEVEVRAMLAFLDQPFEEACLAFHANARAVRTASSEQVRRPINRDGVGQWRPYDAWLGPLRDALGPVLAAYPGVPAEFG